MRLVHGANAFINPMYQVITYRSWGNFVYTTTVFIANNTVSYIFEDQWDVEEYSVDIKGDYWPAILHAPCYIVI